MFLDFKIPKIKRAPYFDMRLSHIHPMYEIYYLLNGTRKMLFDDSIYLLRGGNLVFNPMNTIHKTSHISDEIHERILLIRTPLLLFFNQDSKVLIYAERYVVILLLSQWIFMIFNAITCFVNGVGKVRNTMVMNLLMLWAVRIPAAYVISRFFDGTYVMVSIPISFCFGLFCMMGYYIFSPTWKEIIRKSVTAKTAI